MAWKIAQIQQLEKGGKENKVGSSFQKFIKATEENI